MNAEFSEPASSEFPLPDLRIPGVSCRKLPALLGCNKSLPFENKYTVGFIKNATIYGSITAGDFVDTFGVNDTQFTGPSVTFKFREGCLKLDPVQGPSVVDDRCWFQKIIKCMSFL